MKPHRSAVILTALAILLALTTTPARAYPPPGRTARVSVTVAGEETPAQSLQNTISADGSTVAFKSEGALVPEDTNGVIDVYVRDLDSGRLERVSVATDGTQITHETPTQKSAISLSADGRLVAWESGAAELVPGDTNGVDDVFVHDRDSGETVRVSAPDGRESTWEAGRPALSGDGRYVFFIHEDDELVEDDDNPYEDIFRRDLETGDLLLVTRGTAGQQSVFDPIAVATNHDGTIAAWSSRGPLYDPPDVNGIFEDVFVRDLTTGVTERISDAPNGDQANEHSIEPSLSADGRYVAFASLASNLVPDDRNGSVDVFVHDRQTDRTRRVSLRDDGTESPMGGGSPAFSADGRSVAFNAAGDDLTTSKDANGGTDVFVHDLELGTTELVSATPAGTAGNAISHSASISGDGARVVFTSSASDLVAGDANDHRDIFVREVGPAVGIGGLERGDPVRGWARFRGVATVAEDSPSDATVQAGALGGELVGATAVWRPESGTIQVRADLDAIPHVPAAPLVATEPAATGAPTLAYEISMKLGDTTYRVVLAPSPGEAAVPILRRCDPACTDIGPVPGGLGIGGEALVVTIPASALATTPGDALSAVSVSTAVRAPQGVSTSGDAVSLGGMELAAPRVDIGLAPAGTAQGSVVFDRAASLTDGLFSAGIDGHQGDIWARACLGESCGASRA